MEEDGEWKQRISEMKLARHTHVIHIVLRVDRRHMHYNNSVHQPWPSLGKLFDTPRYCSAPRDGKIPGR